MDSLSNIKEKDLPMDISHRIDTLSSRLLGFFKLSFPRTSFFVITVSRKKGVCI